MIVIHGCDQKSRELSVLRRSVPVLLFLLPLLSLPLLPSSSSLLSAFRVESQTDPGIASFHWYIQILDFYERHLKFKTQGEDGTTVSTPEVEEEEEDEEVEHALD